MSVAVPHDRVEAARARMLDLFPEGFEEVESLDGIELVAYTDPSGEERMWHAFGGAARAKDVGDGWAERWRAFHRPVRVGSLWLGQPWQEQPDDAVAVVIEPGRAFGTGAHPTTQLCLELLERVERGSLLDVGCGSGVVGIAAAKLGFGPIFAFDVDEAAVEATAANADANGVSVDVRLGDATCEDLPAVDVAVANVTLAVLGEVGPRLRVKTLIASGYLVSDDVSIAGYVGVGRTVREGWAADVFHRADEAPRRPE